MTGLLLRWRLAEIQQLTVGRARYSCQTMILRQIDKIIGYIVTRASFDAKSVTKIRFKEEWVFDRESSRMFCRILGIGIDENTSISLIVREKEVFLHMFWVYYPDLRPTLQNMKYTILKTWVKAG